MKKYFIYSFFTLILLGIFSCGTSNEYSQSYIILINGLKVGKLIVNEKKGFNGNLICLSKQERDIFASKEKSQKIINTKMIIPEGKLFPVSYSYNASSGTSYNIKVEDGKVIREIQIEGESKEYQKDLKPNMIMLDLMGYNTIDYWIRKYNKKIGGPQVFLTYILPTGAIKPLTVTPIQTFIHKNEAKKLKLRNYEIEVGDGITMLLWVDKDNHLYRMFVKGPNVEILRSDLYKQLKKDKQLKENKS